MVERAREHVVAVGVFDGVHRGHRRILETARDRAREIDAGFAVVTFEPHPDAVLGKARPHPPLTPVGEKRELLGDAGADRIDVLHFDRAMAGLEPEAFVRRYLVEPLGLVRLVAGGEFALGKDRKGTMSYLADLGARWGFAVESVPLLLDPDGPVSSTRIREFLTAGRVADAARLLGRRYRVETQVVSGRGVGRHLGFPTANLEPLEHQMLPGDGIYAVWATTPDGVRREGAMSIGVRPTLGDGPRTAEVHLLDYRGDLRGRTLAIEFVDWLREERRYPDLERLRAAIAADVERTREALRTASGSPPGAPDAAAGESSGTPGRGRI